MTLIKELHDNQDAVVGYRSLNLEDRSTLLVDLASLFHWFKDAAAVDIYMDYRDDMTLLYVLKSYLRYREIQTSTNIGKRAPDIVDEQIYLEGI